MKGIVIILSALTLASASYPSSYGGSRSYGGGRRGGYRPEPKQPSYGGGYDPEPEPTPSYGYGRPSRPSYGGYAPKPEPLPAAILSNGVGDVGRVSGAVVSCKDKHGNLPGVVKDKLAATKSTTTTDVVGQQVQCRLPECVKDKIITEDAKAPAAYRRSSNYSAPAEPTYGDYTCSIEQVDILRQVSKTGERVKEWDINCKVVDGSKLGTQDSFTRPLETASPAEDDDEDDEEEASAYPAPASRYGGRYHKRSYPAQRYGGYGGYAPVSRYPAYVAPALAVLECDIWATLCNTVTYPSHPPRYGQSYGRQYKRSSYAAQKENCWKETDKTSMRLRETYLANFAGLKLWSKWLNKNECAVSAVPIPAPKPAYPSYGRRPYGRPHGGYGGRGGYRGY